MMQYKLPNSKQMDQRMTVWVVGSNLIGGLTINLFFMYIYPISFSEQNFARTSLNSLVFFLVLVLALFGLGFHFSSQRGRRVWDWYRRLEQGMPASQVPEPVLKDVFLEPFSGALTSFVMWVVAGTITGWLGSGGDSSVRLMVMSSVIGVGGVLTSAIAFFGSDLIWRPVILAFFPEGNLSRVKAIRLSVMGRLLTVFILMTIWPLSILAILSYQRAQTVAVAANPEQVLSNMLVLIVFILLVSLVIAASMAWFTTRSITGPLRNIQAAMTRVAENDLTARVLVTSNDELGYLGERFNAMVAGLRQAELTRKLLDLYISPQVARQAVERGAELGGVQVECSVLFSDIRNFTSLSERLPPAELITTLNRYMSAMTPVVVEQGGMINKFGGDSLLAVFGTPLNSSPDHAARAVCAAQGMLQALAAFNQAQAEHQAEPLRIGIGIATGVVIAGNVGGAERMEYTVIGDTVNLAARLQEKTKELDAPLLISAETYAELTPSLAAQTQPLENVLIRGKQQPVMVYVLSR